MHEVLIAGALSPNLALWSPFLSHYDFEDRTNLIAANLEFVALLNYRCIVIRWRISKQSLATKTMERTVDPHAVKSVSPMMCVKSISANRSLIYSLVKRDIIGRYRGSIIGLLWSFFNPLLMLGVYTLVFGVVFHASWSGTGDESMAEFAIILFVGLLFYSLFSECLSLAPILILSNVNYVKKVVFPLEILPVVTLGAAIFHLVVGLLVWLIFYLLFFGIPSATILQLPLLILPLALMTLGFSWFLSSLGVYMRDVGQVVGVAILVLMFLSPIFYPVDNWPETLRPLMHLSPLTFIVEQARAIMVYGESIDLVSWLIYTSISLVIAWFGYVWFQKTRSGFADVL